MTTPIRQSIFVLAELPEEPEQMTIREAIEWFKRAARAQVGQLSPMEMKELNGVWGHLCNRMAEREGIPSGSLSYFMGELAQTEMRLSETVTEEAKAAGIDYVPEDDGPHQAPGMR